jgi:hypothetical protein
MKYGECRGGESPFAGSLRMSLRYVFFNHPGLSPLPGLTALLRLDEGKGAMGMVENRMVKRVFQHGARETISKRPFIVDK